MKEWRQNFTAFRLGGRPVKDLDEKIYTYEVRPRDDHHGVNLISDVLHFGHLLYLEVPEAVAYAKVYSSSRDAIIRVYDAAGNVIETHECAGTSEEVQGQLTSKGPRNEVPVLR